MTKVMANSPTLLKSYLALFAAVASGTIPAAVRARLAIATAQLNGCQYCLSSHTYIGANITKVDAAELEKARKGESNDPHAAAMLKLSHTIAENAGDVDEADITLLIAVPAGGNEMVMPIRDFPATLSKTAADRIPGHGPCGENAADSVSGCARACQPYQATTVRNGRYLRPNASRAAGVGALVLKAMP